MYSFKNNSNLKLDKKFFKNSCLVNKKIENMFVCSRQTLSENAIFITSFLMLIECLLTIRLTICIYRASKVPTHHLFITFPPHLIWVNSLGYTWYDIRQAKIARKALVVWLKNVYEYIDYFCAIGGCKMIQIHSW